MATQSLPSTPNATPPLAPPTPEGNLTPGKWRHPQLDEIVRRQNAATFDQKNVKKLVWNGAALAMSWTFGSTFKNYSRQIFDTNHLYQEIPLFIVQLFFVFNILVALYPLFRPKDDLSDIPLTPTQRSLLGLDPAVTPPATPGTTYVTPPRYRLSTSRKASPASRQSSPMSANASFSERRSSIGTPFSPASSPLLYKAMSNGAMSNGGRESVQRQSFGSQSFGSSASPLAQSNSFGESTSSMGPSTPSPLMGKRGNLGVKNKWLYERSRRLSASGGTL
ncbi:Nuclear pore complex component [Penicillium fimorum]|uniref:Nuclear pore complex component n=1 Tax=Penicillium fimorum TaxID=1882269 RepID=A0A9X0C8B5_9EURO|nr:Nuclear pore complex component [Penicillium fimorum]